jgi:hypothetical protein
MNGELISPCGMNCGLEKLRNKKNLYRWEDEYHGNQPERGKDSSMCQGA